jgi:hypothetical protein
MPDVHGSQVIDAAHNNQKKKKQKKFGKKSQTELAQRNANAYHLQRWQRSHGRNHTAFAADWSWKTAGK